MSIAAAPSPESPKAENALTRWSHLYKDDLAAVDGIITSLSESDATLIPDITKHLVLSGGKRLRPVLTILSAKLCGFEGEGERYQKLAASIEFIHTATLLHDDVVDESELRRGEPTANNVWGNSAAVLVGDFLFSRAFQLMARDDSRKVLELLSDSSKIISEGEVLQLMAMADVETSEETYLKIINAKTAQLFAAATKVGALISDKSEQEAEALEAYGRELGIAFQIVDDALDYSAKQEALGKTVGDDFREGKMTLPVLYAYAKADAEEQTFWQRVMGEQDQNDGDLATALELVAKHNVLEEVFKRARDYAANAQSQLAQFPDSDAKQALSELADFAVAREF